MRSWQQRQIERDVVADDVGPRGEELAELDIGGAETCDCRGKTVAAALAESPALGEEPRDAPAEFRQAGKLVAGKRCHHAFAHHDPAGPDEPQSCADIAHDETPAAMRVKASSPNEVPRCRRSSCAR